MREGDKGGKIQISRDNSVKVILKAVELLQCFSVDRPEWGLVEMSVASGLHPATCHRVLRSLTQVGFLVQDPATHKYRLGIKLMELGAVVQAHLQLPREAADVMRWLVDQCNETSHLAALDQDRVVYIGVVESSHSVRAIARVGETRPVHSVATGKVFLAAMPPEECAALLQRSLAPVTPLTITDTDKLMEELARIRTLGYSTAFEEYRLEVSALAAPVRDGTGRTVAALALSGPSYRITSEAITTRLAPYLLEATRRISERLGYTLPDSSSKTP